MRDHYLSRHERFARSLGDEPSWIEQLRREAIGVFGDLGFPTTRLEAWRYTNVRPIASVPFELPSTDPAGVSREALEPLAVPGFACSLFVFVDGRFAPQLSASRALAGDVQVESLAEPEPLGHFRDAIDTDPARKFVEIDVAGLGDAFAQIRMAVSLSLPAVEFAVAQGQAAGAEK